MSRQNVELFRRTEVTNRPGAAEWLLAPLLASVGAGARSGASLRWRWTAVTWFENGKATRNAGYADRHEALKAVGLEP